MAREIYSGEGLQEPAEVLSDREQRFRAEYMLPDSRWSLPDEEFENLIDQIDFIILRNVLADWANSCGIKEEINFREANDIYQFDNPITEACFFPEGNVICLQGKTIEETTWMLTEKYSDLPSYEVLLKLRTLELLVHEQVHAISYTRFENWDENMIKRDPFRRNNASPGAYKNIQGGYHFLTYTSDSSGNNDRNSIFIGFDEGVTEALAQEVLKKYLETDQSISAEDVKSYHQLIEKYGSELTPYFKQVRLAKIVAKKIAMNSGLDEKEVWQIIARGKIEGIKLRHPNDERSTDEIVIDGFKRELESLGYADSNIESCVRKLSKIE